MDYKVEIKGKLAGNVNHKEFTNAFRKWLNDNEWLFAGTISEIKPKPKQEDGNWRSFTD